MKARTRRAAAAAAALLLGAVTAGCAASADAGVTTLNFFQFKGEALDDFAEIIAAFEAENPDIRVIQNQVADSETAIRTLLVKNRPPDVITLNANGSNALLAQSGVWHDFTDDPVTATVNPAMLDILDALGTYDGEINALPLVANANGIIYNRDIFAAHGLDVPQTWDELIAAAEALQAAGVTPFAAGLADSWTAMPSFNALGAYAARDGFFDRMRAQGADTGPASEVSFERDFAPVIEQMVTLFSFAQPGWRGATYDDANALFARGEAAMMMQGIWALNPVTQINPEINAAIFPYPVTGDPDDRMLVSGVDIQVTVPRDGANHEEAMRFVEFLLRPDVVERLAASQQMIPAVEGAAVGDNPALQSAAPYFDAERITGFIDHQVPPAVPLVAMVQQALFDGDGARSLRALDVEWARVAARTIPMHDEED